MSRLLPCELLALSRPDPPPSVFPLKALGSWQMAVYGSVVETIIMHYKSMKMKFLL